MFVRAKTVQVLSLLLWLAISLARGQDAAAPSEYRLKAAFLWNFAKFVEWPTNAFASESAPFIIGVLGKNPFGPDLEKTVSGKLINTHPIEVRVFDSVAEAKQCHLLFVAASETARVADIVKSLAGTTVLTVGDTESGPFTENGGMIKFVFEGNKVRFQINDNAAKSANLKISSKLLSLAVAAPAR
jgi:hypothetical protein